VAARTGERGNRSSCEKAGFPCHSDPAVAAEESAVFCFLEDICRCFSRHCRISATALLFRSFSASSLRFSRADGLPSPRRFPQARVGQALTPLAGARKAQFHVKLTPLGRPHFSHLPAHPQNSFSPTRFPPPRRRAGEGSSRPSFPRLCRLYCLSAGGLAREKATLPLSGTARPPR